jgi:antitoxin MazE
MRVAVRKWGNSLAVRIPKAVAADSGLREGAPVEVGLAHGKVILAPVPKVRHTLEELLAGVNRRNLHAEFDTGPPVGREAW